MALKDFIPQTVDFELRSPKDNKPLGIFIQLVGPDAKQVRDAERALQRDAIARQKSNTEPSIEEIEGLIIKKLAAHVVGWDDQYNEDMGGSYSPELVLHLLNQYRWLADQLVTFTQERQNFFR